MTYRSVFPSSRKTFAPITMWALHLHWWPYVVALLCAVAFVLARQGRLSDTCILHASSLLLLLEGFILFMTLEAFVLPFIAFP